MSFMDRRISEYKTAPDVRRVKFAGVEKTRRSSSPLALVRVTSKSAVSSIPVLERKKMFEQTDSAVQPPPAPPSSSSSGFGSVSGRRGSKLRKEISRNTSFRGTKRLKGEDGHSPVLGRANSKLGPTNMNLPMWKKLRNFGHFDLQSMSIESITISSSNLAEHNVKKPTGASAAHQEDTAESSVGNGTSLTNPLISCCTAFTNEIGGDADWLSPGNPVLMLRDSLSIDKQRRVGSRERMIMDGEIPLKSMVHMRGPMSKQVSEVLLPKTGISYPLEFIDFGASYYRNYFLQHEHQNFFGVDENLGPIAISIRRERVPEHLGNFYSIPPNTVQPFPKNFYRVVFRTSELCTLRGTLLEDSIPTGAKTGTSKGIPPRDIVEYISQGEVQMSCLKLGKADKKVLQELVRLDEQELNNKYKVGVIYCKPGQDTEELMYNNESGSPAFDEFLELMGQRVRMKGFNKYRAQLDNKTDTTGEHSVYTEFKDAEVMFHISTLLPHSASNKQQLLRKRHIGNDIVTIIFQEPGCQQFSPRIIRSHFQHIFIIVRVENPNTKFTKYRIAVSRSTDIPLFGPLIPEGAVFDKNDNFRDFMLTKCVNACNASLRNQKFSAMATRTRKQYLMDLAEKSTTSTTIDQANTSGRVAGLLRNLGYKKKERMRLDSTLIFTGGALSWHVSIILRENRPLPFSEDHDSHVECIMGVGPDMIVFMDYFTKDTLLHIPTKDLSGWVVDKSRMNLFYDDSYCLSLDCLDSDDDMREMITRMQAVSPKLTASHEAILMDFRRSTTGLLGFTINEAGVVQRVDGLARSSGLQSNSRLLQVEDRLLCCHTHKQITDLLTAKDKPLVRAYVIPPPPMPRHLLYYPEINWVAVWASRPSHADLEESCKVQNGVEGSESLENSLKVEPEVEKRKKKKHTRSFSHTNRLSYMEALETGKIDNSFTHPQNLLIDDDEPIYDRLGEQGGVVSNKTPRSPTTTTTLQQQQQHSHGGGRYDSINFRRMKATQRATRESVLNLADDLMERKMTGGSADDYYVPQPTEHTVSEVDIKQSIQLTTSEDIPHLKPHQAAPLAPHHRRSGSRDLNKDGVRKPTIEVSSPLTPKGNVSQKMRMFAYNNSSSGSTSRSVAPTTPTRHGANTPLKALASTSEMTKSGIPVKTTSTAGTSAGTKTPTRNGVENSWSNNNVKLRSGDNKRAGRTRPASFDVSLLINNKKNTIETSKDDLSLHRGDLETGLFKRNTQIRTAFRKKSRELSTESAAEEDDEKVQHEWVPPATTEPVPRSPTTGALIGGGGHDNDTEVFMSQENPAEMEELLRVAAVADDKQRLSQNTGSQDSIKNPKLTVRERTQRWEARGGGLPSYFSTLPRSFRHRATDMCLLDPENGYGPLSPTGEEHFLYIDEEVETMRMVSPNSQSGIPLPTSKLRSPRSSVSLGVSNPAHRGRGRHASLPPRRDEGGEEGARSVTSSGQYPSSSESSLERRMGIGKQTVVAKGRGSVDKGKGGSLLPTRSSGLHVSSKKTGQSVPERISSPTSDSGPSDSNKPRRPHQPSSSQGPRHSGIPTKTTPLKLTSSSALQGGPTARPDTQTSHVDSQGLERQTSGDSLEDNFMELDKSLNDLMQRDVKRDQDRMARKADLHIEEWLQQTSRDAVPPDMLGGTAPSPRDITSPTLTDNSLNFSQPSDYSQEMIESLRSKVELLESKLYEESENNNDLRSKLSVAELRLLNAESKRNQKLQQQ